METQQSSSKLMPVVIAGVVLAALVGGGSVYAYEKGQNDTKQANLQSQIDSLNSQLRVTKSISSPTPIAEVSPVVSASPSSQPLAQPTPTAMPDPTASWKTATLLREQLSFKYPSNWQIAVNNSTKGQCGGQNCSDQNIDSVTLTAPSGLQLGIGTDASATNVMRLQGQGCPSPLDTCTKYSSEPISAAGKSLFLVTTGYKNQGFESIELGLSPVSNCILYCRTGIGKVKNIDAGTIQVYASHPGKYDITASKFSTDTDVKYAKQIIGTLHY